KSDEKVVIHISNFRKVKRVEDVIHTFSKIQSKIKAKLLLVGDGPETSTAFQLVKKLGLEQYVLFLGKQKNISELLSISDLKLLLSEQESFGVVLLEAMTCKVPCIGTRVGGMPEVVEHGKTGYLVELGDITQAAAYGIELLTNEEKWQAFSDDALVFAKTHFHSEHILNQYNELLDVVLSRLLQSNPQFLKTGYMLLKQFKATVMKPILSGDVFLTYYRIDVLVILILQPLLHLRTSPICFQLSFLWALSMERSLFDIINNPMK